MLDFNNLNEEELKKIGIEFENKKDAEKFCSLITECFEIRIGTRMTEIVPKDKMRIYEELIDADVLSDAEEEEQTKKIAEWLRNNIPNYHQMIDDIKKEMENELVNFKDSIPGLAKGKDKKASGDINSNNTEIKTDNEETADYRKGVIENLELSVRSYNCLKRAGINTIGELEGLTVVELLKVRNLGLRCISEIYEKLNEFHKHC